MPTITTSWAASTQKYTLSDPHLQAYPLFAFSLQDFYSYMVPPELTYGKRRITVSSAKLSALIETALQEIRDGKRSFTHFSIIQKKNFNFKKKCGLLVLKFKDYPFVLKLFRETPETFANPYCKGIEPLCFFFMAGGANRHLAGITRIENCHRLKEIIRTLPSWDSLVTFPRKWFWLPPKPDLIEIEGSGIGLAGRQTHVPSEYAIIADEIDTKNQVHLSRKEKENVIMQLCNDLGILIDPHKNNYVFVPGLSPLGYKIVIVDTEHFPTMVGLSGKRQFSSHIAWYQFLTFKCFKDAYCLTKSAWKNRGVTHS